MKPLGRRVIVEREQTQEKIGSIIIPEKARHAPQVGRVTAVGDQVTTLKAGDKVLFGKYSTVDIAGQLFIWEQDVIAVLT